MQPSAPASMARQPVPPSLPGRASGGDTPPPLRFTTFVIPDPSAQPPIEERHVAVLPRTPLDTLRLLWREGHAKSLGVTALVGASAAVAGFFAATSEDESVQVQCGASSGALGALSLAGLWQTVSGIRATLARDDGQRAEPARLARTEYHEREAQRAQETLEMDERLQAAMNHPVEGRRFITSAPDGKGNRVVTVHDLGPIVWNPVTGRHVQSSESAPATQAVEGPEGPQGEDPEGYGTDSSSSEPPETYSDSESVEAGSPGGVV